MMIICDNFRGFLVSRPPLVLFVLILSSFTIVLFVVNYVVEVKQLQNPDEQDWNGFLSGFTDVQFCIVNDSVDLNTGSDDSSHIGLQPMKQIVSKVHDKLHGQETADPNSNSDLVTTQVPFRLSVLPTSNSCAILHTVSFLRADVNGKLLGIQGANGNTMLSLRLQLPSLWNSSENVVDCSQAIHMNVCVEIMGPAALLPYRISQQCVVDNSTAGVENHYKIVVNTERVKGKKNEESVCTDKPTLAMTHNNNPKLAIMLTLQDKSAIGLHLKHTVYFLFVVIVTLFCYAIVRGKQHISKSKSPHYIEVDRHD